MKSLFVVNKGDDVKIPLDVTGIPSPDISCYHKDRLVMSCPGKTIENTDISHDHSAVACQQNNYIITGIHELIIEFPTFSGNDGLYKCEANNTVATDSTHFRVNVTGKIYVYYNILFLYLIVV